MNLPPGWLGVGIGGQHTPARSAMLDYFIMRHGPTDTAPAQGAAMRRLTPSGHCLLAQLGARLQAGGVSLAHILHSPLLRAQQSALALATTQPHAVVEAAAALAPGGSLEALFAALSARRGAVLTVGHLPDVCGQLAYFTGNEAHKSTFFEAASIASLQAPLWEPGVFTLRWHQTGEAFVAGQGGVQPLG
ncbi:MAG: hypothetical protein EOO40_05545 [Deltaproteobacteria bacterium]|nr:MAG: hypothetical protein EOO40_05545 [Deltaproteobacteria bacterium]